VLKWLETASEQQISRFAHYLQCGQISISASLIHLTPLCSAEQITRALYPIKQLRKQFGIELNAAIHHDVNGQPGSVRTQAPFGIDISFLVCSSHHSDGTRNVGLWNCPYCAATTTEKRGKKTKLGYATFFVLSSDTTSSVLDGIHQ
jgi:hypothetical protein